MPLIPPNFSNISSTPQSKPPWARGLASNNQQVTNEVPWSRNLKSGTNTPRSTPKPPAPATSVPQQLPIEIQQSDQPLKTSTLQINLKSVKKPEASSVPHTVVPDNFQTPVPPTQLRAKPESIWSAPANQPPPTAKVIPIPIAIQKPVVESNTTPLLQPTKVIPIHQPQNNDPPGMMKAETKVKLKNPQAEVVTAATKMPQDKKPNGPAPPAPPPPPGGPPAPPPPPPGELAPKHVKIEQLRKAPRKRPDWASMMKEIERGRKLNHVQCNDRSKPILPKTKSHGKFVFESEAKPATKKDALHHRILNEIQQGVKLKKVHCNDRSKPILTGLRVRRQSSVAEGDIAKVGTVLDPMEELAFQDIDDLRDELQSAKQMLQAEIEQKHGLEKKARDQKCQIIEMEAEIETLKAKLGIIPEEEVSMLAKGLEKSDSKTLKHLRKSGSALWKSPSIVGIKKSKSGLAKEINLAVVQSPPEEEELMEVSEIQEEIVSLKEAVQHARKQAEEMEQKYKEAMEKLEKVQSGFEDSEQKRKSLERKVESLEASQDGTVQARPVIQTAERTTQTEEQILEHLARQQSVQAGVDEESEEEEESDIEVDEESVQKKKQERELILWENKLKSIKDKQHTSRTERKNLKVLQKKLEAELKDASKRHKKLQKEVDKMAKMLKDAEKDEDDEEEEEEEEEKKEEEDETDEEEEEEEEEESESEEEKEDDESSEEDDENAGYDERLSVFGKRVKRRENVLSALRKGNYLLRANIDRLKDDLEEARIAYHDLEHELKSVLEDS